MNRLPLVFSILCAAALFAPPKMPQVGFAFPAGGERGKSVTVVLGGQHFKGAQSVLLSRDGLTAVIEKFYKDLSARQIRGLLNRRKNLRIALKENKYEKKRRERIEKQVKTLDKILSHFKLKKNKKGRYIVPRGNDRKRQPDAQLEDRLQVRITIPADAVPGELELRVQTPRGLSNPQIFTIGTLSEINETEKNDRIPSAMTVPRLPIVINGQIMPGDDDRFRFSAKKGERLVFRVRARALVPYMADAVPGWFQAVLTLYHQDGRELAYIDDDMFRPDPVLAYTIPVDGDYVIGIRDAIHRGRADFVYRITAGQIPHVRSCFPLGGPKDKALTVTLEGEHLPSKSLTVEPLPEGGDNRVMAFRVDKDGHRSNPFLLERSDLPEIIETDANHTRATAQPVALPIIVNGRIDRPGDKDHFSFYGKKGDSLVAEVTARRLGSPLDAWLLLYGPDGKVIARNDDRIDPAQGLATHHADAYILTTLPRSGRYVLRLIDTQNKGGTHYAYRLRISAPRPDFHLMIAPSSITLNRGETAPITVLAARYDGFQGSIQIFYEGNDSFSPGYGIIPAGVSRTRLTVTAPRTVEPGPRKMRFYATAAIDGRTVKRYAVPAEDRMQAFLWRHLVKADDMVAYILKSRRIVVSLIKPQNGLIPVPIEHPGKIMLRLPRLGKWGKRRIKNLKLAVEEPAGGLMVKKTLLLHDRDGSYVTIQADRRKWKVHGPPAPEQKHAAHRAAARPTFCTCWGPSTAIPGRP